MNAQWDPAKMGPINRWFLERVFRAPGGFSRFLGLVMLAFTVLFAGITVWVFNDPNALQSDRDFFPFITVFFGVISVAFLIRWFVAWLRAE